MPETVKVKLQPDLFACLMDIGELLNHGPLPPSRVESPPPERLVTPRPANFISKSRGYRSPDPVYALKRVARGVATYIHWGWRTQDGQDHPLGEDRSNYFTHRKTLRLLRTARRFNEWRQEYIEGEVKDAS